MNLDLPTKAPARNVRPAPGSYFSWEPGAWGYVCGRTVVARLDGFVRKPNLTETIERWEREPLADAELLARMAGNTRREVVKAAKRFHVGRAGGPDILAFSELPRHGEAGDPQEWLRPEMLLLVALERSQVVAGSGFTLCEGGWADYRVNASREDVRRSGVNALLAYEGMKAARDYGCLAINWSGNTCFKRHLGGEVAAVYRNGDPLGWGLARLRDLGVRVLGRSKRSSWLNSAPSRGMSPRLVVEVDARGAFRLRQVAHGPREEIEALRLLTHFAPVFAGVRAAADLWRDLERPRIRKGGG